MAQNWRQVVYSDFSGGYNDISPGIDIADKEMKLSENADYSAEVKALQTRKGCSKAVDMHTVGNLTDGFAWLVGSTYKKCVVANQKLYDVNPVTGAYHKAADINSDRIYPFVMGNILYFGTGEQIYTWGAFDYLSDQGIKSIKPSDIVKCTYLNSLPKADYETTDGTQNITQGVFVLHTDGKLWEAIANLGSVNLGAEFASVPSASRWRKINAESYGIRGKFYRRKSGAVASVNLARENYTDTEKWEDVTDVDNFSSSAIRPIQPYDPSQAEEVLITVSSSAVKQATVTVCLDNITKTFTVAAGEAVSSIVTKLSQLDFTNDWQATVSGNSVLFSAKENGAKDNGYVDPSDSGITFSYETITEGMINDSDISQVVKCTIFCVHQGSQRVFAAGNPDDSGLYFSEVGKPNYFKSEINKVYPAINGYGKVTGMINLSNSLLVSYESGWCSWTGVTPLADASWRILNLPYGCVSPRTICLTPNSFTFLAKNGIYCVSASILSDDYVLLESSQIIKELSENTVENTIKSFKNRPLCEAIFYDNVYMLTYSTNGVYCDRVLKYEWSTSSFTLVTGWQVNRWMHDPEELYFASKNYLLKAFDRYTDVNVETGEDQAIQLRVKTKEFHFGSPVTNKVAQLVGFIFQQHDEVLSSVRITIHAGYQKYELKEQDLAESLYYGRTWGKMWGYREAIVKVAEIIMVSNTFQIEIENDSIEDPLTLIGIGFIYDTTDIVTPTILKDEVLLK